MKRQCCVQNVGTVAMACRGLVSRTHQHTSSPGLQEGFLTERSRLALPLLPLPLPSHAPGSRSQLTPSHASPPGLQEGFLTECSRLARLRHPNIITLLGISMTRSGKGIVLMEYAEGGLGEWVRWEKVSWGRGALGEGELGDGWAGRR